jgi:hypothetical protein
MKEYIKLVPKEKNVQKRDIFLSYRSNSQNHYKDISNFNYDHRIKLNPTGEYKTMDIRSQIPTSHIHDSYIKSDYTIFTSKNKNKTAYEKANLQSKINYFIKAQKHQNLLEKEKNIKKLCGDKNDEIKKIINNKKNKLKEELTKIIKDAIKFSKKNNPIRSMLPENINEIVEKAKKETQELSLSLNMSHISKISKVSSIGAKSSIQKIQFLNLLGVDLENLNDNNVNLDIDKCWHFVEKIAKGRKVEDILRYKVVNEIMNVTEKKSAEKAKKIYEKLEIYKKYMKGKKTEEMRRKRMEEEKRKRTLKMNSKEFIRQKMQQSLSQPKMFNKLELEDKKSKTKRDFRKINTKKNKKIKRSGSEIIPVNKKKVLRLDAYNDVNRILEFIEDSKSNSQSKLCKGHFTSIQMTKEINNKLRKVMEKNEITYK